MLEYIIEHRRYLNIAGIALVLLVAYLFSTRRSSINYKLVINALLIQAFLGLFTLRVPWGQAVVHTLAQGITKLYSYAEEGARFLFGSLTTVQEPWGFIFAFRVLPIIIFFSAFIAILFHYRIIQIITIPINKVLYPLLNTSAAETLCAVANSFLGQTEAPLLVRGYIPAMTRSELLTVMVSGMGTMSGPLLAVYAAMGVPIKYLLSASVMAIPATILISKMLIPETGKPKTAHGLHVLDTEGGHTVCDAIAYGTADGLKLALAVGAMLIAFIALIALSNNLLEVLSAALKWILSGLGFSATVPLITLQTVFGCIFGPIAWLLGLSGNELTRAGELLGLKLTVNEMVAYADMVTAHLSPRAVALLTFALGGFANFSSIGIQIAGIGTLAPEQQKALSALGLRAVLGGTLANLLSAFIAGLFL